ncbi:MULTISPECIES: sulfite oxidase heme-binding subunit YedZ [Herbaspirillum]|jgi:sulfoxide reductase heme-binding subunit YedZ|uniref:sulfite oxidase heme-binding subunit YedZ n=1 Tax=Herbaspirillum TaxID=963 RepID=UPI0004193230|nr:MULTISPECIES: protein-methionine-sulfoxide reductase heme-binding subunit MsrQ [Herbaspirillum]MAF03857.1 sulfoxide reductase heme-binding subunit YedZ [Herbaspirillum sp.]MBO14867.1 sulfoxide reductase heme-binding subunit YedZ [Herbaspirillum sp.]
MQLAPAALRNLKPRTVTGLWWLFLALAFVPLGRLVVLGFTGGLGANPLEFITHSTGDWTLYLFCITLAVTPLRKITGLNWLVRMRRMLGLMAFLYLCLHFTTFVWFDHFFDLGEIWKDIVKRPFITVGVLALLLSIPLAITSTNGMVRRLGGKRWQALHRLVYVIVPLGVLHYWWDKAGKNLIAQPLLFAVLVGVMLALRLLWRRSGASGTPGKPVRR